MANQLLNSNIITNHALTILHQKLNFVGSINRAYDDSFTQKEARIGSQLRIALPNQYTIRRGPALNMQDTVMNQVTLPIGFQSGVDVNFTSQELTLNINDFSERILEPAMNVLAANIENDALAMATSVWNQVNGHGSAQTFRNVVTARKLLRDNLAPAEMYALRVNTQDNVDVVDQLKGLFQDSKEIKAQYLDGVMGRTAGFEWAENTFLTTYTRGAANAAYTVNGAGQIGSSLVVQTGAGAMNAGDVFTIAGVNRVHPETKANTGVLQQFVVTAAYGGGAGVVSFAPAIVIAGGTQNVTAAPANTALLVFAGTASTASGLSLAYHKNAFTFATCDMIMPNGVDMAARKMLDGISMRLVRAYDINNDRFPARFDLLYGFVAIRPQLAVRLAAN